MPGGGDAIVQQYGDPANRDVLDSRPAHRRGDAPAISARKRTPSSPPCARRGLGNFTVVGTEIVGPVVGEQLKRQGLMATVLALGGILAYIALRFQFSFAIGAIAATLHDLLVCLAFLSFFKYDLTLNVIAGLLTITGYSVNDTIVDLRSHPREHARHASGPPHAYRQRRGESDAGADGHHGRRRRC